MRLFAGDPGGDLSPSSPAPPAGRRRRRTPAQRALPGRARRQLRPQPGRKSRAARYVVDLTTGQPLFSQAANTGRLPASVEKIYTTSTALLRLGPTATFTTSILGDGLAGSVGVLGRDALPARRRGSDVRLSALRPGVVRDRHDDAHSDRQLLRATGITAVNGAVVGDESYWDSVRGTPATGFARSAELEGELSALAYDRGLHEQPGHRFQIHPALYAAQQLAGGAACRRGQAARGPVVRRPDARRRHHARSVTSPTIATLIQLTNTPSDNFFAETLLKDIGARFGGRRHDRGRRGGRPRRGRREQFGDRPAAQRRLRLSRYDRTTPGPGGHACSR